MGLRGRSLFENEGVLSFVTTTVMNFDKIFAVDDAYYKILIDSLKFVLKKYNSELVAYVLMPNHIHLIVYISSTKLLSSMMRDFKKFTSVMIKRQLVKDNHTFFLNRLKNNANLKYKTVFKLWMDRFDDLIIYNEKTLWIKMNYIHNNPVKGGLVKEPEDWKYSSYRNYFCDDESVIDVCYY